MRVDYFTAERRWAHGWQIRVAELPPGSPRLSVSLLIHATAPDQAPVIFTVGTGVVNETR